VYVTSFSGFEPICSGDKKAALGNVLVSSNAAATEIALDELSLHLQDW
jgi:hypothetical protein